VRDVIRIGIDIGGTFTDFAIWRHEGDGYARIGSLKLPSTRPDYAGAVIDGIERIASDLGIAADDEVLVAHGTTISTNAVIERSQPPVALITTEGYRDILEIARLRLDKPVDLFNRRPPPLAARRHVHAVPERILADGTVDRPLDEDAVLAAAARVASDGIGALAICFLHAWRNPVHEARAAALIRSRFPDLDVVASHEVWPQQSEYERATLALLNVYVKRLMAGYLSEIADFLSRRLPRARLLVTKSNGGAMSAAEAVALPVHTLLSGPAAGVTAARALADMAGARDVLTMDMGGTSTDVALVQADRPTTSGQAEVGDFPLLLPVTAVEALGAGGGSLVWLDAGVLKVGPKSAGSRPGPACYDQGGTIPTLTDAYLLCGYLPPEGLLGGRHPLSAERAHAAFAALAGQIGDSVERVADAAIAVATATMQARILPFLARQGVEPSDLTLMIYGGAGGLHGPLLARELGIRRILVPRIPSVFCAYGCLVADLVHDAVQSVRGRALDAPAIRDAFGTLAQAGAGWIAAQGSRVTHAMHSADMRYAAQSFTIPVDLTGWVGSGADLPALVEAFHAEHRRLFDHADPEAAVVIDDLRTRSHGASPKPHATPPEAPPPAPVAAARTRSFRLDGVTIPDAPVYARDGLPPGWRGSGPAIIEQDVATILVPPGYAIEAGALGDLWLTDTSETE
jgi:N-methylhydantoinase A